MLLAGPISAQNFAISTNATSYLNLGTLNMEVSYAFGRHWSAGIGFKYNPFTYMTDTDWGQLQNRQRMFVIGTRYWPWHVFSGWWINPSARYQEYNVGGLSSADTTEGERIGGALCAGYTYMLGKHFNLELGAGVWAGSD